MPYDVCYVLSLDYFQGLADEVFDGDLLVFILGDVIQPGILVRHMTPVGMIARTKRMRSNIDGRRFGKQLRTGSSVTQFARCCQKISRKQEGV